MTDVKHGHDRSGSSDRSFASFIFSAAIRWPRESGCCCGESTKSCRMDPGRRHRGSGGATPAFFRKLIVMFTAIAWIQV